MTHPRDRVYRFVTREHWGQGVAENLLFAPGGGLVSLQAMTLRPVACATPGAGIRLLTVDLCGRLLWLEESGAVRVLADGLAVRTAAIPPGLAASARRLIPGQDVAWLVADGDVVRLDARTGQRTGAVGVARWRTIDAVADRCDGVIVVEAGPAEAVRLRQIRPDGRGREIPLELPVGTPVAMTRGGDYGAIHLVLKRAEDWLEAVIHGEQLQRVSQYPDDPERQPGRILTTDGQGRLFMAGRAGIFAAGFGLVEPAWRLARLPGMAAVVDLVWSDGQLWAATARGICAIEPSPEATASQEAVYVTPPLHSPLAPRSGWQRADLQAVLPKGAQVRIRSRSFETDAEQAAYARALRDEPGGTLVREGWDTGTPSLHSGNGEDEPLRHHLGDREAPYIALRIELSLPAGAPPAELRRLEVIHPDRSLIESLPAIYRTDDGSEAQFRRMLAPFQALADEIDDLIGDSVRRVDPATADDLWAGFLLGWVGHGSFARLSVRRRRALLEAMPEILSARGTLRGLARAMDALAPQGYAIEDAGLAPDLWVLPGQQDPAGARLGRETHVAPGAPDGLRLGCDPLGQVHLGCVCADPARAAGRCSAEVTVRVWGGAEVEQDLAPFTDRIARAFVPAHTRVRFLFGGHLPPELLERGRPAGPDEDPDSLFTLDPFRSLALGAWRLPATGSRIVRETTPTLDSAVLDAGLILA